MGTVGSKGLGDLRFGSGPGDGRVGGPVKAGEWFPALTNPGGHQARPNRPVGQGLKVGGGLAETGDNQSMRLVGRGSRPGVGGRRGRGPVRVWSDPSGGRAAGPGGIRWGFLGRARRGGFAPRREVAG